MPQSVSHSGDVASARRTHAIVRALRTVADEARHLGHGLDTNDALDREVRLVRETTGKVVRAQLELGDERILDEELRPLVKEAIL